MDWSHDFCLWCDTQTLAGSLYCSQACRLADLEKPGSTPTSPCFSFFHDAAPVDQASRQPHQQPRARSGAQRSSGQFHLPPPFDFAAYRAPASSRTLESPPTSPRTVGPPSSSHAPAAATTTSSSTAGGPTTALHLPPPRFLPQTLLSMSGRRTSEHLITRNTANRTLNASSSRSSLSSVSSTSSSNNSGISDQALSQLQGYANSFDHVRDWKRRVTLG
jgi:ECL1/2/3 zinc binding proteins